MSWNRLPWIELLGLILFLGLWQAAVMGGLVDGGLLPAPTAIPAAFLKELNSGSWFTAIGNSMGHYLIGLGLGSGLGILLGLLTGLWPALERGCSWVIRLLRPIPGLAWVPFAIIWFGVTPAAAVFIIVVGVFWINYFSTLGAVQTVDAELLELAAAFGQSGPMARLIKIIIPAAMPGILAGLRTGLGQAWMAVVAAELFGVAGLGQRMMQASSLLRTDIVIVYMVTMAGLYGLLDMGFVVLRNYLLRWKP